MSNTDRKSIVRENKRLKHQVEVYRHEIDLIKHSKAYTMARLMGQAKKQFKENPTGFSKKAIKKILTGTLRQNISNVESNLSKASDLQSQYLTWMQMNEPDSTELDMQRNSAADFSMRPLISTITPASNPPDDVLRELIR